MLAAFGINAAVQAMVPVARAWSNRVYRLTTDAGSFAVKELRNPWQESRWSEWLVEAWQFEQQAYAAGVSMPTPILRSDGGCLAWVDTVDGSGEAPVRLHHWIDGYPAPLGPVDPSVARWAGRLLATLHDLAIVPDDRGRFPIPNTDAVDRWPSLVAAARRHGASWAASLADHAASVEMIADLAGAAALRSEAEVMSHGDVDQKNIVLGDAGPALCDWDVAGPVVPRRELADVAMSLAAWSNEDIARQVVTAYRESHDAELCFVASDLGPSMMSGLDWLAFNVERAIGARPAEPADAVVGDGLVPELLAALPGQLAMALRLPDVLSM